MCVPMFAILCPLYYIFNVVNELLLTIVFSVQKSVVLCCDRCKSRCTVDSRACGVFAINSIRFGGWRLAVGMVYCCLCMFMIGHFFGMALVQIYHAFAATTLDNKFQDNPINGDYAYRLEVIT